MSKVNFFKTSFKYETSKINNPSLERIFFIPNAKSFKSGTWANTLLAVITLNSLYFFLKKKTIFMIKKSSVYVYFFSLI